MDIIFIIEGKDTKQWVTSLITTQLAEEGFQLLPKAQDILLHHSDILNPTKTIQTINHLIQTIPSETFLITPQQVTNFIKEETTLHSKEENKSYKTLHGIK